MALIGPDGEQHSHLDKRDIADPAPPPRRAQRPIKGTWVGTRRGEDPADYAQRYLAEQAEANMTPHEQAVTQAMQQYKQDVKESLAQAMQQYKQETEERTQVPTGTGQARRRAAESLGEILEDAELLPHHRRILTQALGVLGMLA